MRFKNAFKEVILTCGKAVKSIFSPIISPVILFAAFLKKHNEIISFLLISTTIILFAAGFQKLPFTSPKTFLYAGGLLFIFCNYKRFSNADWQILKIPVICAVVIVFCMVWSFFDPVIPTLDIKQLSWPKKIRSIHIEFLQYFEAFLMLYFFVRYAARKYIFALFFVLFACSLVACGGLANAGMKSGFFQNVQLVFQSRSIAAYGTWTIILFSFAITGIVFFKNAVFKILSLIVFGLAIVAICAQAERSYFVAFFVMIFAPFFVLKYKHKFKIIFGAILLLALSICVVYEATKDIKDLRWNVAKMIDNSFEVLRTNPIEMGKYDGMCNNKRLCYPESTKDAKPDFLLDHSIVSRLAMRKSHLYFMLHNFEPHNPDIQSYGKYSFAFYEKYEFARPYRTYMRHWGNSVNGYDHPHDFMMALWYSYGWAGFGAILFFMAYLVLSAFRTFRSKQISDFSESSQLQTRKFVLFWFLMFIIGLTTQCLFDILFGEMIALTFGILGSVLAFCARENYAKLCKEIK